MLGSGKMKHYLLTRDKDWISFKTEGAWVHVKWEENGEMAMDIQVPVDEARMLWQDKIDDGYILASESGF